MTDLRQGFEINILGCRVKYKPDQEDSEVAQLAANLVLKEIETLKFQKPTLKDTDVAVLVALKIMTEKLQLEKDCKRMIVQTELSLKNILNQVQ